LMITLVPVRATLSSAAFRFDRGASEASRAVTPAR
jgi:hypothetical protein